MILFWILVFGCILAVPCQSSRVEIYPSGEELILSAGDPLNLMCRSDGNVTWIHDNVPDDNYLKPSYHPYKDGDFYVSNLTVDHLSYLHVGYYKCQSTTIDDAASIYIYVKDQNHLLAFFKTDDNILALEGTDLVIPCKPTEPNVTVELYGGQEDQKIIYNLTMGFTIKNLESGPSEYNCEGTRDSKSESISNILVHVPAKHVFTPIINGTEFVFVGQSLTLTCNVDLEEHLYIKKCEWDYPAKNTEQNDGRVITTSQYELPFEITIQSVTPADVGKYVCRCDDHYNESSNFKFIRILDVNNSHLELKGDTPEIIEFEGTQFIQWIIDWEAFPKPDPVFTWFSPKGENIGVGGKYEIIRDAQTIKLVIRNLKVDDCGVYQFKATHENQEKTRNLTLKVLSEPKVSISPSSIHKYYIAKKTYKIECSAISYPQSKLTWRFYKCENYPKCDVDFGEISGNQYQVSNINVTSILNFIPETTGKLMCWACNKYKDKTKKNETFCHNDTKEFLVTDVLDGFSMFGPPEVVEGDDVTLTCGANKYHFDSDVNILYNNEYNKPIANSSGVIVSKYSTNYSNYVKVSLSNITVSKSGEYVCSVRRCNITTNKFGENACNAVDSFGEKKLEIHVKEQKPPKFDPENNVQRKSLEVITGKEVNFTCRTEGTPTPLIAWYKDKKMLHLNRSDTRITFLEANQILRINHAALSDEGNYECIASNRVATIRAAVFLKLADKSESDLFLIAFLLFLIFLFAIVIFYKMRKAKQLKKALKKALKKEQQEFDEGQIESLNPKIGIDEQADLLPYDKKWEIPKNKVKLGIQIGSGAFGVVKKAEVDGIIEKGEITTVAVKMIKNNTDAKALKALRSELKIMTHIGKHLNIVNLLGACTRDLPRRELLVIIEYCKYGNLHNYLQKNRNMFVNQIDAAGNLDTTITFDFSQPRYVNLPKLNKISSTSTTAKSYASTKTAYTTLNSESQPENNQMIGSDGYLLPITNELETPNLTIITTHDLMCWSFQIAKGMEYLVSRKVLHGDLAARNILLADDKIVKISDFGLSKSMYTSENYQKTGDEPLPIKWMAIESIKDRVFSTQSDVWAYGVVLWELFSLAEQPYPGIEIAADLYRKLIDGHRMEKPEYATKEIYKVMLDCWEAKPIRRPGFTELAAKVGELIEDNVKKYYLNLNEVYLKINDEILQQGQDYLAMLESPDFESKISETEEPHYDDSNMDLVDSDIYDSMKRNSRSPVSGDHMELKPMLPKPIEDSNESKASSFSNPSYLEFINNQSPSDPSYMNNTRGSMNCVDDYNRNSPRHQEVNKNRKLNWLFPADIKGHTTFV